MMLILLPTLDLRRWLFAYGDDKKFQFAAYYVNPLLTDHVDTMRPIAARKRIELELRPAPATTEVFCDADA